MLQSLQQTTCQHLASSMLLLPTNQVTKITLVRRSSAQSTVYSPAKPLLSCSARPRSAWSVWPSLASFLQFLLYFKIQVQPTPLLAVFECVTGGFGWSWHQTLWCRSPPNAPDDEPAIYGERCTDTASRVNSTLSPDRHRKMRSTAFGIST